MNSSVMELRIKVMGDERSLEVSGDATVGELKKLISQIFKQPPCTQKLSVVRSEGIVNLDDVSKSLSSYGLQSGSVVILLITKMFQVLVKNVKGIIGTYDVDVNETVSAPDSDLQQRESPKGSAETDLQQQTAGSWQEVTRLQHHVRRHHLHDPPAPRRFIEEISTTGI